jgi:putative nucleotidyltransferase with HDIG domain
MSNKRILLADADSQVLVDFRQAMGDEWQVVAVPAAAAALSEMEKEPFDVVVADLDLKEVDGCELLNRIQAASPKAVRFILAGEADHDRVVKKVLGAHQFIAKPLEASKLKATIERALALDHWIPKNSIRELVARIRTLPTIPSLYLEVQAALKSSDATTEQVGAIIAKDMAMMTKLLQVINSACFGLPRKITNPTEAVGLLGFETVNSMVMAIKVLSQFDKVKPVYFSIDRLWRHSTEVARNAKQIAMWHTEDSALADAAFTGGLLHDLGKVVLAANFDEQYRGAQSLALKQNLPLWDVEKEIFGASHGEIGAYLLGLWGMPLELHEIAAFHHHPSRSLVNKFTPLTAVHIANAFEYETNADKEGLPVPKIDEAYLAQIGVLDCLDGWRSAIKKRDAGPTDGKTRFIKAEVIRTAIAPPPIPAKKKAPPPRKDAPKPKSSTFRRSPWIYGSLAAAIVLLLLASLTFEMVSARNEKAQTAAAKSTAGDAPAPPERTAKEAAVAKSPVGAPVSSAFLTTNPTPTQTQPSASIPSANAGGSLVYGSGAKFAGKFPGFPDMKLQGIIFSDSPSAIINGKRLQANDVLNGVLVVNITSTSVLLEYNKQRRTLVLE